MNIGHMIYDWGFIVLGVAAVFSIGANIAFAVRDGQYIIGWLLSTMEDLVRYAFYAAILWYLNTIWLLVSANYRNIQEFAELIIGV
ncbi:MAG: hypothetical protein GF393_12895 [Armatimonadia bacterium]|nr:hypothetical protein [Armatimonadia bacterium]